MGGDLAFEGGGINRSAEVNPSRAMPDLEPVGVVGLADSESGLLDHAPSGLGYCSARVLEIDDQSPHWLDRSEAQWVDPLGGANGELAEEHRLPNAFGRHKDHAPVLAEQAGDHPRRGLF